MRRLRRVLAPLRPFRRPLFAPLRRWAPGKCQRPRPRKWWSRAYHQPQRWTRSEKKIEVYSHYYDLSKKKLIKVTKYKFFLKILSNVTETRLKPIRRPNISTSVFKTAQAFYLGSPHISILAVLLAKSCGRLWRYAFRLQNYEFFRLNLTRNADTAGALTKLLN